MVFVLPLQLSPIKISGLFRFKTVKQTFDSFVGMGTSQSIGNKYVTGIRKRSFSVPAALDHTRIQLLPFA